jgi:hypothetical protein
MMILRTVREQARKPLHISIRQVGEHFRVVYERQYPHAVEESCLLGALQDATGSTKVY